jgi:hypothetical protein
MSGVQKTHGWHKPDPDPGSTPTQRLALHHRNRLHDSHGTIIVPGAV